MAQNIILIGMLARYSAGHIFAPLFSQPLFYPVQG